jgi:hypothetical protein
LLDEWIDRYPGTRPWAWWAFDAPERRQVTDGDYHPFDHPDREAHIAAMRERFGGGWCPHVYALWFGRPRVVTCKADDARTYEPQLAYLQRLKLLTADERAALGVSDD